MTHTQKGNISIIEDNAEVSRMYERAFRFNGYEVKSFYDGESAQNDLLALKDVPAAILLDIGLPRMNGIDVLRNIRKNPRFADVPIIILTNSFYREDEERFLSAGANLYLIKIEHQSKDIVEKTETLIHRSKDKIKKTGGEM